MILNELKTKYKRGGISKPRYIVGMHKFHRTLQEYADFLKDTDVRSIEITDGRVVMTTREKGIRLVTDGVDKRSIPLEILNFGFYEKEYLSMMLKLISDRAIVFDIGANIGWYSLNISKSIKDVQIYAFEPIRYTYLQLGYNLNINGIVNVIPMNIGLGEKGGIAEFFYYKEGLGNASLRKLNPKYRALRQKRKVERLDDFVLENKIKKLDFIKCDVEGGELFVFKGGIETLKKFKPVIFTEMLRKWSRKFGYHPNEIIKLLIGLGYECFILKNNKLKKFIEMDDKTEETNFFFLHKTNHSSIIPTI